MGIVSDIRGLCCRVCLNDVWQLLRDSFLFPRPFVLMLLPRDVAYSEIRPSRWGDKKCSGVTLSSLKMIKMFIILQNPVSVNSSTAAK